MTARFDVVSLGEALVDFLPEQSGARVRDVVRWTPCLGGAPANVAVGVARLGGRSALVGLTGDDEFGYFLREGLARENVDVTHLRHTSEGKTGLGFVTLTEAGERSFTFYRTLAAETFLSPKDTRAAKATLALAKVLHAGTNSLLHLDARAAVRAALVGAARAGRLTSIDPNLRLHLWKKPRELRVLLDELTSLTTIVKLSDEEISFVTGRSKPEAALLTLERRGVTLGVVTLGPRGAMFRFRGKTYTVPAATVKVVDTTGAGDGFTAGLLFGLTRFYGTRAELAAGSPETIEACATLGACVGSRVIMKLGAVAGLPTRQDLLARRKVSLPAAAVDLLRD
jgi:fructokinase